MDQATRNAFAGLRKTIDGGFAAVAEDITTLRANIASLRTELKSNVEALDQRLDGIHGEVRSIRRDLDSIAETVANVSGFRKEIDHALERISAIERHLGIDKKIRA